MRSTVKVSIWPVAFVARMHYERPICKHGKVIGFFTWVKRSFAPLMAGFAVNLKFMLSFEKLKFSPVKGRLETLFLSEMVRIKDLEARADNCTKVEKSRYLI
jgi:galactosylgalactosylxylosylprotein 3-beta-glucuronosyltransferase 1